MADIAERYIVASGTKNLQVSDKSGDADVIIAAGMVAGQDPRMGVAMHIWRIKNAEGAHNFHEVADACVEMLRQSVRDRAALPHKAAQELVKKVLFWWLDPACKVCNGLGHPTVRGTPILDHSKECEVCNGTGVFPLEKLVTPRHANHARWLSGELNRLSSVAFSQMQRKLRSRS